MLKRISFFIFLLLASCTVVNSFAQTMELDMLSLVPPAGPNLVPLTIPFSYDAVNDNTYSTPTTPITVTVSLQNQVYTGLPYNATAGLTFGGGATLSSGGFSQQSASNIPFDLLGTYSSNGGPKSYMFTSSPIATPAQLGTGFDVDGDLFSPNLNGGVQLFTAAQVLFDNNVAKDARVYFGEVKFTFSQPIKNPVLHFAGLGGSYSFLPLGLPDISANYLSTFFTSELELQNPGVTSTLLSSNSLMTLTGNNILNNYSLPNGNSNQITGEYPIDNYGAMTGSVRINGTVQEVVYKVYLKGSPNSDINWSTYGMDSTVVPPVQLVTGATRDPFTGDIWWATASFLAPTQQISGNVFHDIDSLKNNNIATNGASTNNDKVKGAGLFANLINSLGLVEQTVPINSDGLYLFDSVDIDTYTVQLSTNPGVVGALPPATVLPQGWTATGEQNGLITGTDGLVNSISAPITVGATDVITNVNFGIRQPMSIGNLVWNDSNKDGIKDAPELGIAGAIVNLYNDVDANGAPDGAAIATFTTPANGLYAFNGLFFGNYVVGVTPPIPPTGNAFVSSPINESNANNDVDNNDNGIINVATEVFSSSVALISEKEPKLETPNNATAIDSSGNLTVDFAFYQPVNISGNLFVDNNGPTNVDGAGIGSPSGMQQYANLYNAAGNVVATTPINSNGTFQFLDVQPNTNYSISVSTTQGTVGNPVPSPSLAAGWANVSEDCCDNTGNDGSTNGIVAVSVGTNNVTNANFGINVPLFLGNYVWTDLNGNGLKDEPASLGLNGVVVQLLSPGPDNVIGGGDDIILESTTTANLNGVPGYYLFDSLSTGLYYVSFPITNSGAALTTQTATSNVDNNSNPNTTTGLTSVINLVANDTTIDAGYVCVPPIANAGNPIALTCTTPSGVIGTTAIAGNTYSWLPTTALSSSSIAQPTSTATATTIYTVTVTAPNGCTAISSVTVTVSKNPPVANAGTNKDLTCTTTSATLGAAPTAGNTYSWAPATGLNATNIANPIANPIATTIYTLTVTGANGCTAQSTVAVNVNTTPPVANAGNDVTLNCNITSATIGTAAIAGNTYSWSLATGLSAANIAQPTASPTSSTSYTVLVTSANGCTATDIVAVSVNTLAPVANAGPTRNLNCTTTSATIGTTAVAGSTYLWSPATALSATNIAMPTANPTATTVYTVTVTGANGCTAQSTVTVNVDIAPPIANAGLDLALNCTTTSGTIGTAAIAGNTYSWSLATSLSATNVAQPTANPTSSTNYTVTVTGENGCTATDVLAVMVNTLVPAADAGPTRNLNCTTTSASIGTTPVAGNTYAWSPATGLSATNIAQPTANPSVSTVYTLTVTGTNGCTAQSTVSVNVNTVPPTSNAGLDLNLNCTTTSGNIGTVAIAGNTYNWSPATNLSSTTTAQPIANPSATTSYTVLVTGANGCTSTDVVVVNVNTLAPVANAGPTVNLNCTTTSATIGTAAIIGNTYSWSPVTALSATNIAMPIANPIAATIYTVVVTAANGCTALSTVSVNVNTVPPTANAGVDINFNCTITSGMIGTAAIAGNTYSWSPSTALTATNVAQPIANPTANTNYTVTVTGANGCVSTDVVLVSVNTLAPIANAGPNTILTCSITTATIGTAAIAGNTYLWSPATNLSSSTVAEPIASPTADVVYTLTVTGANGCTAQSTVSVNLNVAPPIVDAGLDRNLNCSITSAVIGTTAIAGNTYTWSPATSLSSTTAAQPIANPSVTTSYTVVVTGTNGCASSDVVVVNVNTLTPTANAGPTVNLNCTTTSATIGTAAIIGNTYSWSPATALSATNIAMPIANPIATTIYTVTVTGANGCTAQSTVSVNVNILPPTTNAGNDIALNCTTTSGMIGTAAIAGNTYSWSPTTTLTAANIAQPIASPITTTSYTVTVMGANGCNSTDVVMVSVNTLAPVANAGPDQILTCSTTSATIGTASISGHTYSWSPATSLTSTTTAEPIANPTTNIVYTLTVTGANGCTAQSTVAVNLNIIPPTVDAGLDKDLTCVVTSSIIGTTAILGNTYTWSPATNLSSTTAAQPIANPSVTTSYTVIATGTNGCTSSDVVTVNVNTLAPIANAGPMTNLSCTSTSATIGTTALAGNTYAWSPATDLNATNIAMPIANPSATTIYTLTVTSTNNCTAQTTVAVNVNTTPPVITISGTATVCNGSATNITASGANSYVWNTAEVTPTIAATVGIYTVTGTAANGCTATKTIEIVNLQGSVGNYVWIDSNGNGLANEMAGAGINAVPVELWNSVTNSLLASTMTANDVAGNPGYYNFVVCASGNYFVKFPTSVGAKVLTVQAGIAATDGNSDADINTGISSVFAIDLAGTGVSKDNLTIDAGYLEQLSVGNLVWNDINRNGLKDATEPGIFGATVNLYRDLNADGIKDGVAIATVTTNATGLYIFDNLESGNYVIGVVPPTPTTGSGFISSAINETTADVDNNDNGILTQFGETLSGMITLNSATEPLGELPNNAAAPDNSANLTIDFAFYQPITLRGNVWHDYNALTDGFVNNSGGLIGATPIPVGLRAYLVNPIDNKIVKQAIVSGSTGVYNIGEISPSTNYYIILSKTSAVNGAIVPAASLPIGWENTGEKLGLTTGSDGVINGRLNIAGTVNNVINANFGIRLKNGESVIP